MVLNDDVSLCRRIQHLLWLCLLRRFLSLELVNGGSGHGVYPALPMAGAGASAARLRRRYGVAEAATSGRIASRIDHAEGDAHPRDRRPRGPDMGGDRAAAAGHVDAHRLR